MNYVLTLHTSIFLIAKKKKNRERAPRPISHHCSAGGQKAQLSSPCQDVEQVVIIVTIAMAVVEVGTQPVFLEERSPGNRIPPN
jgi:hypothetical protein